MCIRDSAIDDFGATVDDHLRGLLASGVGRLVRRAALRRVAVATTDPSVVRWMQPDYVVLLGGGGRPPTLLRSPHAAGAAAAWRPQITIAYSTAAFDEEGEDQADPLLAAVAAGGGRAAHSSAPGYGVAAGGWREARARVVLDLSLIHI